MRLGYLADNEIYYDSHGPTFNHNLRLFDISVISFFNCSSFDDFNSYTEWELKNRIIYRVLI